MDRYQRVEKPKAEATPINENEIRITALGRMRNYITYATTLLQDKESSEIVLKAMGRAINKTVMIAELIKRRIVGLHQNTSIGSTDITDVWEPLEEGLLPLETTRHVSMITITLSKKELFTTSTGYQPPIPADQVKPLNDFEDDGEGSPRFRAGDVVAVEEAGVEGATMELLITMEMVGMVGVVMVAEQGAYYDYAEGAPVQGRGQQGGYYDYAEGAPVQGRGLTGRGRGRGRVRRRGRATRLDGQAPAA
ncbi:hypothetical protein M0R45_005513 [Rubus argutus]|uniref:DNA/RNA-binding protein Alba-like domain-containing protein n=1 Tax=Rubus argutus TaxID=59490 RepID=A0AAW1YMW8_RUBAR